jgi:hypothetical protein
VHGAATAHGGPGRDEVIAYGPAGATLRFGDDGDRDVVRCGKTARPRAETLDAADVPLGCGPAPRRARAGALALLAIGNPDYDRGAVTIACPDDARRCRTTLSIRAGKTIIYRGRAKPAPGVRRTVWLKATRALKGIDAIAGRTLIASATARDRAGRLHTEDAAGCVDAEGIGQVTPGRCAPAPRAIG